jgi:cytochrome c
MTSSPNARIPRRVTLACLAAGCLAATPAAAEEPAVLEKGRHALETRCARCHAIGPEGASAHGEAPPFRDIMKRYPPEDLEESLAEGIMSGHPDMPEFILAPDEISAVVAYLHTLGGK